MHTSTFQLLDKPWSQVSSLLRVLDFNFYRAYVGFSNPTARRFFIECCLFTLSRFPQVNFVHKKKSPRIYTSVNSGGFELTKLTYTKPVYQVTFFFSHTSTFQLLDKPWSQVSSLPPPGSCLQFLSRIGFNNHCSSIFHRVANSRSRAFRKSIFAQEKVPTILYEYAIGGARTHETDLYQARG